MTKMNSKIGNETKSGNFFFNGAYSSLSSFFHWSQNAKIF